MCVPKLSNLKDFFFPAEVGGFSTSLEAWRYSSEGSGLRFVIQNIYLQYVDIDNLKEDGGG